MSFTVRPQREFAMCRSVCLVAVAGCMAVLLPAAAAPVPKGAEKEAVSHWEHKAVSFGADEKEGTKKLNDLARDGWEYVGPLGNGLVAFKRFVLSPKDAAAKKDREKLQGVWYTVSISSGDTETGEDKADTIAYDGDRYVQHLNGTPTQSGTFRIIDATADPKQIEYTCTTGEYKGNVWQAIYTLDGDDHRICTDVETGGRPKEFSGKAGFLRVTKREKK